MTCPDAATIGPTLGLRASCWKRGAFGLACLLAVCGCGSTTPASDASDGSTDVAPDGGCLPSELADPYFMITPDWTATGAVTLAAGSATFTDQTRCEFGGVGRALPSLPATCARPAVMILRTTFGFASPPGDTGALGVRLNGGWNFVQPPTAVDAVNTLCLGTRLFGGEGALFLGGGTQPLGCDEPGADLGGGELVVSGVSIGPDLTRACPPVGEVANGDFEAGATGWSLVTADGTAEIAESAGAAASRAGRIATERLCAQPRLRGRMSIPLARDVPNPALHVWARGSAQSVVSMLVGPGPGQETQLVGDGNAFEVNVCLPRWAQGTVQPISFRFVGTDGVCAQPAPREFLFDDLAFVSEPGCAAQVDLRDPGFEQGTARGSTGPFWVTSGTSGGAVDLRSDPAFAHAGAVSAVLSASGPCALATLQGDVTIPGPGGPGGPSLSFWYRTDGLANARLEVGSTALPAQLELPAAATWTRASACLNGRLAGRPDRLTFVLRGGGGECAAAYDATETVALDDVALTTDQACP
jgi:hypothetical protein